MSLSVLPEMSSLSESDLARRLEALIRPFPGHAFNTPNALTDELTPSLVDGDMPSCRKLLTHSTRAISDCSKKSHIQPDAVADAPGFRAPETAERHAKSRELAGSRPILSEILEYDFPQNRKRTFDHRGSVKNGRWFEG